MNRRVITTFAYAIVALGILFSLYYLFFANNAELVVSDNPFGGISSDFIGEPILEEDAGAGEELAPRFIRITDRPVAEGIIAMIRISTTTTPVETASGTPELAETVTSDTEVRFIDRASGNIYRYMAHERSLTRLSNKTLPGIQEASWLPDGSRAYVRFLTEGDQVATYVLPENGEGGFFLEQGLASATAVGSSSIFTLLSGTSGSVGSVSRSDGTNPRTLFTSLLSSLAVRPSTTSYYANTKPSLLLDGYAFQINATNGAFNRVLGPFRGLSTLPSPNGSLLLYSYLDRGTLRLAVLDVASRSSTPLPLATLIEKCTWSPDSLSAYCAVPTSLAQGLPDTWYQGAVTFSDRIWKIDMQNRLATLVIDPAAVAEVSIDGVALHTDPAQDVIIFTDKHSGSLWVYDL